MVFNSLQFLVFFLVVTLWFFRLKNQKNRILLLLVASCYFYMSFIPVYILILGGTIIVDYFAGIQIEKNEGYARKTWLILSLIANIGTLAVFKYYNFFLDNLHSGLLVFNKQVDLPFLKMALPIGLSFHTFQAMSYTIEVYRKKQMAERNFIIYSLYVMFYPQLVAGPIERPQNILPQLHQFRPVNYDNIKEGISRMCWGFFKKSVIADRLAMVVDYTHLHISTTSSLTLFISAILYSFQIYCDFSGYSDIAIGAAKVMNIQLMENFNQPYLSKNISSFWANWHISLSGWFRDYLYIPLGGNRKGNLRRKLNVFIVFILSGLWHGANRTFLLWGLLHGILVVFMPNKTSTDKKSGLKILWNCFAILVNFLLVTILWIFFRSENIHHAFQYIKKMATFSSGANYTGIDKIELLFSFLLILILIIREKLLPKHYIKKNNLFYLYTISMIAICYYFGVFVENQFIYFQF